MQKIPSVFQARFMFLYFVLFGVSALIIGKLFWLQVVRHNHFIEIAQREQFGETTLPARRGEIILEDYHSKREYKVATNTTLDMIYADPTLIKDPATIVNTLAPLLFKLEDAQKADEKRMLEEQEKILEILDENVRNASLLNITPRNEEELFEDYKKDLYTQISTKTRDTIMISSKLDAKLIPIIKSAKIPGIEVSASGALFAYPKELDSRKEAAKRLAEWLEAEPEDLERILEGKNRYTILQKKLTPEVSMKIEEILEKDRIPKKVDGVKIDPIFLGIRLQEEYYRFYPEQEMASQILGFVDGAGNGNYGIEATFNDILKGQDGIFSSKTDVYGNQITIGNSKIQEAIDGADIYLTIDRAIQIKVEKLLKAGVEAYRPDSGTAIVMNPKTGAILAMAQYPTFNPNDFKSIYELEKFDVPADKKEFLVETGKDPKNKKYWFYTQTNPDVRIELFPNPEKPGSFLKYKNNVGPEVYKNKSIQEVYEPGSIFKPLMMASAINAGEVEPRSTFVDDGPLQVDFNNRTGEYDFTIDNFNGQHHGVQTMTQVLEKSNNIGMAFIARTLGKSLMYSYIKDFGLTKRTNLGLDNEVIGQLEHYRGWTESEHLTKSFGQGISVTPLQMVQAYSALANEGTMMKPYLVKKIVYPTGEEENFIPEVVQQVLTKNTAEKITAMLSSVIESYARVKLEDHYIAGKSGTAQTYKWGKALSGPGTTMASFIGYGPVDAPQFLVLVKLDRPRSSEWAEGTSGNIFHDIMEFLYDYYKIAPDKNRNTSV